MQRAFIVKLEVDDLTDSVAVADDITDLLASDGYNVIEVNPWSDHKQAASLLGDLGLDSSSLSAPKANTPLL